MKNTAFDNVFNLRKAVERMVRTALASGASHSDVHSAIASAATLLLWLSLVLWLSVGGN